MDDPHDRMEDPRDFRKRLCDHIVNIEHDIKDLHDKVEAGDRSLMQQHDFMMAYRMGLINSLKIFDTYQKELWAIVNEEKAQQTYINTADEGPSE